MGFQSAAYLSEDTIAALATPVGGALSIVRVSGKLAFQSLAHLTCSAEVAQGEPRKLIRTRLLLADGRDLDDALVVRFVNPHSYTGEDTVEYHLHGGAFIATELLQALSQFGIRQALPGEFSFRAVKNGKMSLFQAQAVADLISATNHGAVSLALEKLSGTQNQFLENLAAGLRQLAVLGEVGIDFSDQDVDEVSLPRLKVKLQSLMTLLERLQGSFARGFKLQDGIKLSLAGLPNAGKSSFFNALLGEDRSIVSQEAGTTRDVIRERMTLRSSKPPHKTITLRLEDTAGLRKTAQAIEQMGIERTHQSVKDADLLLFIVDPSSPFASVQEQWASLQQNAAMPRLAEKTLGVFTKCDLQSGNQLGQPGPEAPYKAQFESLGVSRWVNTSAHTGAGIPEAVESIVSFCEKWVSRDQGEVLLTRLDHLAAVTKALEDLRRALEAPEIDLFASDIRQSLYSLGPVIGDTLPDDILGTIFSDFCIGK